MEDIYLSPERSTPEVKWKYSEGYFELKGMSLPEDTDKFYSSLLEGFNVYMKNPKPLTEVTIGLAYYNTTTARALRSLLKRVNEMYNNGSNVKVTWAYESDDPEMKESIQRFDDITDFEFNIVAIDI